MLTPEEIDEMGRCKEASDAGEVAKKRYDQLRKRLQLEHAGKPEGTEFAYDGLAYSVTVSACGFQRRILSMAKLYRRLGKDAFLGVASVTFTALDRVLSKDDQQGLVVEEQTGERRVTVCKKMALAA